jgi:antitoxin component YwqK of YwqJK toxin-antitoxin module
MAKLKEVNKDGYYYFLNEKGNKEGKWYQYDYLRRIVHEVDYKNGVKDGLDTWYDAHYSKEIETPFKDGQEHGTSIVWYAGGSKKYFEREYDNGKLKKSTQYDYFTGNKVSEVTYNDKDYIEITFSDSKRIQIVKRENEKMSIVSLLDEEGRECNLPSGKIIVWKACRHEKTDVYVKIEVPAEAKRLTVIEPKYEKFTYKSRISSGRVLEITDKEGNQYKDAKSFIFKDNELTYIVGEIVESENGFDDNPLYVCSSGIYVQAHKDHCDQWYNA